MLIHNIEYLETSHTYYWSLMVQKNLNVYLYEIQKMGGASGYKLELDN